MTSVTSTGQKLEEEMISKGCDAMEMQQQITEVDKRWADLQREFDVSLQVCA